MAVLYGDSAQDTRRELPGPRKLSREKSTKELAGDLARQTSTLVHRELDLAKADIREKAKLAGAGAGAMGVAAVTGVIGLASATAAAIAAIALVWPVWAAALVVSAAYLLLAGILAGPGSWVSRGRAAPWPRRRSRVRRRRLRG